MSTAVAEATTGLALLLPDDALAALAQRVAEIAGCNCDNSSPWLTREEAAAYLHVKVSRLEKDRTVPSHRWSGRVMYHRPELDEYLLGLEAA